MPTRGLFVTFEGGDGSGKSTQIELLAETLVAEGRRVISTREPGGAPAAESIRDLMVKGNIDAWSPISEALMMFAARAEHLDKVINPARDSGVIVLCDRFSDSTMAYQGIAGGVGRPAIESLNSMVVGDHGPTLTFVLDIDPIEGLRRARSRANSDNRFESKGIAYHTAVREAFQSIALTNPGRCILIDAAQPVTEVREIIVATVQRRLAESEDRGS